MPAKPFCAQALPTDNAVAVLQNLVSLLGCAVQDAEIARTVYEHPDFPFISLQHLVGFLKLWQIETVPLRVSSEALAGTNLPAIAYTKNNNGAFVVLCHCDHGNVTYLHPATGWAAEPIEVFAQHWNGALLVVTGLGPQAPREKPVTSPQRTAIATTFVNAGQTLHSFIKYHTSIGFDHIFLFADGPDNDCLSIAKQYKQVTCQVRDTKLESAWKECKLYPLLDKQLHRPQARQLLNVEVAIQMAAKKQIDWLLQIDIDELFYSPNRSVQDHFSHLSEDNYYHSTYLNYEGACQKPDVADYFKEVSLFKTNPHLLSARQRGLLVRYAELNPGLQFLAYSNGKSAARVESNLVPWGNHEFRLQHRSVAYQKKTRPVELTDPSFPIVLHYAECGFSHFLDKYKTWGNFPDTYLGGQRISGSVPFRTAARDIVLKGCAEEIWSFYESRAILPCGPEEIEHLVKEGLLAQLAGPSRLLGTN